MRGRDFFLESAVVLIAVLDIGRVESGTNLQIGSKAKVVLAIPPISPVRLWVSE